MQTKGLLQAVIFMIVVAAAASCAATKEYSSKLFSPRTEDKNNQATALRFLELDSLQSENDGWVSTDIIMGRDTANKTASLDKLAKVYPAVSAVKKDTATVTKEEKTIPVMVVTKPIPVVEQPIAKNYDPTEVRNKKTRE